MLTDSQAPGARKFRVRTVLSGSGGTLISATALPECQMLTTESPTITEVRVDELMRSFAGAWLKIFARSVQAAGLPFHEPHAVERSDEVVFEWWRGGRSLSAFVRGFEVELLESWGINMHTEMKNVEAMAQDELVRAWKELIGK